MAAEIIPFSLAQLAGIAFGKGGLKPETIANVCREHLGEDTLATKAAAELDGIGDWEREQATAQGHTVSNKMAELYFTPEVAAALTYVYLETHKAKGVAHKPDGTAHAEALFNLSAIRRLTIASDEIQAQVTARFPALTQQRIKAALTAL